MGQEVDWTVWATFAATAVTAIATGVLAWVTWILVRETRRMADATNRPNVVVTIEPSVWSLMHVDLVAANTGTGAAYDVEVAFDPPLELDEDDRGTPIPLQKISVLKPGQSLKSFLSGFGRVQGRRFDVSISWVRTPASTQREMISYVIDMSAMDGTSQLGLPPLISIARSLEGVEKRFGQFARSRFQVDVIDARDRLRERRARERFRRAQRAKQD